MFENIKIIWTEYKLDWCGAKVRYIEASCLHCLVIYTSISAPLSSYLYTHLGSTANLFI